MLQRFELKDFKCHEDYNEIKIPGFTVISGTNNSGKSSLLQALYLLTQNKTKIHTILSLNEELELGGFSDILHKSKTIKNTIEFSMDFSERLIEKSGLQYLGITLAYSHPSVFEKLLVNYAENNPVLSSMELQYKKENEDLQTIQLSIADEKDPVFYRVFSTTDNGYCKMQGIVPDPVLYKDTVKKDRIICSPIFETIREYLSLLSNENIKYLKAVRLEDFIDKSTSIDRYMGLAGEYTAEIIYKMWDHIIDFNKADGKTIKFSELFDGWVKKLLGDDYRIRSYSTDSKDKKYKVTIEEINRSLELNLKQVGVGISQILPIITLILTSKEHDVLLIENPEVHLHPKLQAIFVDLCLFAAENNRKLVVETHSEHVINRLRFRIKENPRYLENTNILFLEKLQGNIRYTEVHVSKDGKIDFWPENFFDQNYKDLLGLIK
jgi:predicted ATPase